MTGHWTIGELAMEVERALATGVYLGQQSGRIRDVPDRRTIRYYTTIGLLDKPAEMRGRTAYYGRRHLLQLVAIKRLQAQGKSLVEVQAALMGVGDSTLAKWSALPEATSELTETGGSAPRASQESSLAVREDFWASTPQAKTSATEAKRKPAARVAMALHLKVLDNVTLVIEGVDAETMDAEMLASLQPALENLKNVLQQNGSKIDQQSQNEKEPHFENEREQP